MSAYEVFSVCRNCRRSTIFLIIQNSKGFNRDLNSEIAIKISSKPSSLMEIQGSLNSIFEVRRPITIRDNATISAPLYLPDEIKAAFEEGAACHAIGCYNAAGTMFRLCLDLVTRPLLPETEDKTRPQPTASQRRTLGFRLPWLFDNHLLPEAMRDLANAVREDGNDSAHSGNITENDASDLLDFTVALLERLVTETKKLEMAAERRALRRKK